MCAAMSNGRKSVIQFIRKKEEKKTEIFLINAQN